jgi:dTDP-4-amino-4,6-dideoxygalactose transaminase
MILITKPFLPPQEEYNAYLNKIWNRNWLTNNGPLVNELEEKLKSYLQLTNLSYVANGTLALQIAIKSLDLKGEIITTPFSYVATTSSIVWEGCRPVFVDINTNTLNIDENKIEQAITPNTSAILATHVYGIPCNIRKIEAIAQKHKLKVIYDAAHAFGVKIGNESIFNAGDISITSLHATKLYHSVEGGLIFCRDEANHQKVNFMRNFGHNGPVDYAEVGINAKNSEFHAAMGLCNLKYIDSIIARRKELSDYYDHLLMDYHCRRPLIPGDIVYNYAYYPVVLETAELREKVVELLMRNDIFPRRYFNPSLDTLFYVDKANIPVARDITERVLCLPLYYDLERKEIEHIVSLMKSLTV